MNRYWKWGLAAALSLLVIVPVGYVLFLVYHLPKDMIFCFDQADIVSQNGSGDMVEQQVTVCDGFANSFTVSLNLMTAKAGEKVTFFKYDVENDFAAVSWENDRVLDVEVAKVGEVFRKRKRAGDIEIRYKIGHVSSP